MKHRKLFPALTATNQSVDCPDFCDATCPYGCYTYPDYFMPPPPPPPLVSPQLSTGQSQSIPTYVIIIVSLLASFFLLVSYYAIVVKYCARWNRFRPPPTQSDGPDEEFLDENRGLEVDHPIWYIATVGLQPSIINSITVFNYKRGDPLIEGTECSVCLSEFRDDDTLRLLPKCNHAFHVPCIDTWLRSHTNCPLCRASILSNAATTFPSLAQNHQNANGLSQIEDTQMGNSEIDDEMGNNLGIGNEVSENRGETEDEVELTQVYDQIKEFDHSKGFLNPNDNKHGVLRGFVDYNSMGMEDEIQSLRRSMSMDSPSSATKSCRIDSEGSAEDAQKIDLDLIEMRDAGNSSINEMIDSASITQSQLKSSVSMKRSFSHGGQLFLSRHSRSPNSILPL